MLLQKNTFLMEPPTLFKGCFRVQEVSHDRFDGCAYMFVNCYNKLTGRDRTSSNIKNHSEPSGNIQIGGTSEMQSKTTVKQRKTAEKHTRASGAP